MSLTRDQLLRYGVKALLIATPLIVLALRYCGQRSRAARVASQRLPWWGALLACIIIVGGVIGLYAWYDYTYLQIRS